MTDFFERLLARAHGTAPSLTPPRRNRHERAESAPAPQPRGVRSEPRITEGTEAGAHPPAPRTRAKPTAHRAPHARPVPWPDTRLDSSPAPHAEWPPDAVESVPPSSSQRPPVPATVRPPSDAPGAAACGPRPAADASVPPPSAPTAPGRAPSSPPRTPSPSLPAAPLPTATPSRIAAPQQTSSPAPSPTTTATPAPAPTTHVGPSPRPLLNRLAEGPPRQSSASIAPEWAPAGPVVVRVRIGHLEVRADQPAPPPVPAPPPTPEVARSTLDTYLERTRRR